MSQIICKKCVMDLSAKEITFDENGVCNFCHQAQKALKEIEAEKHNLPKIIAQIKKVGKKYDCLVGLSGGVDSSTALHHAVKLGLRPLCFNVDTGYNKPDADSNILKIVEKLKVPFYRYTIDLKKFKKLQAAFLKAGVPNVEIPTDHVLLAVSMEMAHKYGIGWIVSGGNVASESIMPPSWGYLARDLVHIKDIYMAEVNILSWHELTKKLPVCGLLKWNWRKWVNGIKTLYLLDFLDYNRVEAEKMLIKEYGFVSTGEKHEENFYTWWFQNFYLYEKFGIDKRKAHYSSLINSGQMTRYDAMEKLKQTPEYPLLGIESKVMKYPTTSHENFKKDNYEFIAGLVKCLF